MLLDTLIPGKVRPHFKLDGPSVLVPPPQVGALAIVLHELIANCIRHGSLAPLGGAGAVNVQWSAKAVNAGNGDAPGTKLTLKWRELGGAPIEKEPLPGPGTSLLRGLVRFDLQGSVELTYPRNGAMHTLRLRLAPASTAHLLRGDLQDELALMRRD